MTKFSQFLDKKEKSYDYSSVQIPIEEKLAYKILSWGDEHIKESDLYEDINDPSFGREEHPHITILYGIHTDNFKDVQKVLKSIKPFEIQLDNISLFNNKEFDVIKIDVIKNPKLSMLNLKLKNDLECTETYPEFKPHITIAYTKKKFGDKFIGNSTFKGTTIKVKELVFSSKKNGKYKLSLV